MGNMQDKDNSFRRNIILGLISTGTQFSYDKYYKNLNDNYGLIIKPLNLDPEFKAPIRYVFKGFPYHVGIINGNKIFSFCPDLKEPHRGTLWKDIYEENLSDWECHEIFWLKNDTLNIKSRLIDLINVHNDILSIDEFNYRYNTFLQMEYNLLSNNCTDVALTVLIGQTRCFQIEGILDKIKNIKTMTGVIEILPEYAKKWLYDFKKYD